jgi:hypothetical protein
MTTRHVVPALLIVLGAGCGGGGDANSARNTSGVAEDAACAYEWLRATWNCSEGFGLVEGVVENEDGEPLRNANIEFLWSGATTDENGAFSVCKEIGDYSSGQVLYLPKGSDSINSDQYPCRWPGVYRTEDTRGAFAVTKCEPAQVHYRLTHEATADGYTMLLQVL